MKIFKMETNLKKNLYSISDEKSHRQEREHSLITPVERKNSDIVEISPEAREAFMVRKKRTEYEKESAYFKWLYYNSDRIAGRTSVDSDKIDMDLPTEFLAGLLTG